MSPVCSVYSQVLQLFPRGQLANAVKQHQAELSAKGFTSWEQFARFLVSLYQAEDSCAGQQPCRFGALEFHVVFPLEQQTTTQDSKLPARQVKASSFC